MPCNYLYKQLQGVNKALRDLTGVGILEDNPAYQALRSLRNELLAATGITFPRRQALLKVIIGLSPGGIRVWYDSETGWNVEARETPGANPVYHSIDAQTAAILLKPDPPPELVHSFMKESAYIGE